MTFATPAPMRAEFLALFVTRSALLTSIPTENRAGVIETVYSNGN